MRKHFSALCSAHGSEVMASPAEERMGEVAARKVTPLSSYPKTAKAVCIFLQEQGQGVGVSAGSKVHRTGGLVSGG